ncbi:MAG TPA: enoyl-CoA hydratase/isomerase family protein [Actinomycetes bacterium]|nr:enoyl-CoA hydratase/isomerase family protein [Actinomycetes bacterium]
MSAPGVLARRDGPVAAVLLDRPSSLNAFDLDMADRLAGQLADLAADEAVRAVVIGAAGAAFCAGGDLKWALAHPGGAPAAFHQLAGRFHQAILEIRRMPKPVVAAVNGVAAGGGLSLALACDFRVMARSAVLRQAYTASGLSIDGGGTFSLPRLVGLARALEIAAFDRPIPSGQALAWGLVTAVADDDRTLPEATAMAAALAGGSVHAFAHCKRLLGESFETPLEAQLERERAAISACAAHHDGQEGLRAFAGKRPPRYPAG